MNIEKCMKTKCEQCKRYNSCFKEKERGVEQLKNMQKNSINLKSGEIVEKLI